MAGEQQALSSLQLVAFRDVLDNVVQQAHAELQQLAERLPAVGDEERKRQLLQHLQTTRQRLQRLHVCAQWAHKAKAVNTCREVLKASQDHGAAFVHAADELFRLNEELRFCRAPLFDVSFALHIMQTGTYRLLPSVIEDELQQPGQRLERPGEVDEARRGQQRRDALRRLDFLLRSKLLASELPAGMRVLRVRGGQAWVAGGGGQYKAQLTLVPAPRDDVTLAKYRPPGEAEEAEGAIKEEPEVAKPAGATGGEGGGAAAASGQPSSSTAAAQQAALTDGGAVEQRQGTAGWRWQLLSFELLPAAAGRDPPPLLPQQRQWLQQHIEQRMWVAGDVEQLARLGKTGWVVVPQPASASKEQQQGKASSAPAPSSSLALSQQPAATADSKEQLPLVRDELDQQQQQGEAGQQLPPFSISPLAAMHAILCQTAGRLALFSILLSDARQLEGGSWKGCLKLSRAASGSGIRLAYWQQLPVVGYSELLCLREGQPYQLEAGGTQQQQQEAPAVEVSLQEDGRLAAASSPQLQHPQSGEHIQLPLPLDSAASLSADRLLLQAAASSAAVQLAAVQAVLQRAGRLAPAGNHAELLLLGAASPAAGTAGVAAQAPPPTSPLLQLWSGGSLQLSLTVQLRSGRLLLAAGSALLESEQGPSAAAAVAAAQQQLDAAQREALTQPLPPGSSRGMLGAALAAEALGRLSLQLSMRQRMDAAAADASACGLRRATLPARLLQQHLRQVALLVEPPTPNTLTLALPAFLPPPDMQQWARQQQQQPGSGGAGAAGIDGGATRCFLLIDFGEAAAAGGTNGNAERRGAPPRLLLAVCSCTGRGTVTRVLQLSELPQELLLQAQQAAEGAGGALAGNAPASRKRRADDAAADGEGEQPAPAPATRGGGGGRLGLASLSSWCRRQASWAALRAQMLLLPVQYAEELALAPAAQQQPAQAQQLQPPPQQQQVIRLPKAPVLGELESWAAAHLAAQHGGSNARAPPPARRPVATMQLEAGEAEAGAGRWRVDIASAYFGHLEQLLRRQGIALAPPQPDAAHIAAHSGGLTMHYSLQKGHSVLTGVTDMVRVGMLHLCLTRLAGCMAVNPLAAAAQALAAAAAAGPPPAGAAAAGGANGGLAAPGGGVGLLGSMDFLASGGMDLLAGAKEPGNGGLPNGVAAPGGQGPAGPASGGEAAEGLVWPLPGCGSVRLQAAGLTHVELLVAPPPAPKGQLGAAAQPPPPPVRVTVTWADTLAGAPRAAGGGGGGLMQHIRCGVACEPPLPPPVTAALAQQLEAGRADLFLDALCLAAHSAAAAAAQLTPQAQRAAGLLPGAVKLLGAGGEATSSVEGAAGGAHSSALRLRAQVQHGEHAATLCLSFHAVGYTLLQLQPAQTHAANAAAASWMPAMWQRLSQRVPSFAPLDAGGLAPTAADGGGSSAQQAAAGEAPQKRLVRQAWVHRDGLAAVLAEILHAVGAPAAAAPADGTALA